MNPLLFFLFALLVPDPDLYKTVNGVVNFESNAALENIKAKSNQLRGVINKKSNTFSFAIKLKTFHGFNSELQMEHFNENYVESTLYTEATFKGKIIEDLDWRTKNKYPVRAKGEFTLHGVTKIETINASVEIMGEHQIKISGSFILNLSDYNIKIPRVVHRKLSQNIDIQVTAIMQND